MSTAIAVALASLALYLLTMAPGLTWKNTGGDGGDFLAAAFTWGIPHPTGYPAYIVLLRTFGELIPLGSEAFRGNLFSAVCAAIAGGLFFGAVWRLLGLLRRGNPPSLRLALAAFAALSFATSNLFWSQATITEVYTLGALFAAAILWLTLEILDRQRTGHEPRWTWIGVAFLFGLSLGNNVTIALFTGPFILLVRYELFRRFGRRTLYDWRPVAAFLLGLSIYVYAPIASAQDPPLNWFMPHTWTGFWQMASASLYRGYLFGTRPGFVPERISAALNLWLTQYSLPGAVLGIAGLSVLWERYRLLAAATLASALLLVVYAIAYYSFDPYVYLVPVFMLFAAWIVVGLESLVEGARTFVQARPAAPSVLARRPVFVIIALAVLLVPVWSVAFNYRHVDISDDHEAQRFIDDSFSTAGPGSLIFSEDVHAFSLWYQEMVAKPDADVAIFAMHLLPYDWYWRQMQRRYPDRMPKGDPPQGLESRIAAVIEHNRGRGIFFSDSDGYAANWELAPAGPIFQVVSP